MFLNNSQGVVSVILVMPQFLNRFPRVSESAAGAGFWKGLLTAMIELGALIGWYSDVSTVLFQRQSDVLYRCPQPRISRGSRIS